MCKDIRDTRLWEIISPYDNWFNSLGKNDEAKSALKLFISKYNSVRKKCESVIVDEKMHIKNKKHYFRAIEQALIECKYERVCNELLSFMYYTSKYGSVFTDEISNKLNELLSNLH